METHYCKTLSLFLSFETEVFSFYAVEIGARKRSIFHSVSVQNSMVFCTEKTIFSVSKRQMMQINLIDGT